MKVKLERLNDSKHFKGTSEEGHSLELSGDGNAVGPMQSVLMEGIDVKRFQEFLLTFTFIIF